MQYHLRAWRIATATAFLTLTLSCVANGSFAGKAPAATDVPPAPTRGAAGEHAAAPGDASSVTDSNSAADTNTTYTPPPPTPFLSIANDANGVARIVRNGQPFYILGYQGELPDVTNYCAWTGADMRTGFAHMRTDSGANTVRLWFLQSAGGPGNWTAFDSAIAAAQAQNLVIVATLVNQWGDCEPQVGGVKNYKTVAWYQSGYKTAGDGYALSFRDFAQAVARRYAAETTIGLWQLVNEAEARNPADDTCPSESAAAAAIRGFADDMATLLHTADPNHLVNLGTQDNGYCGVSGNDFQYIHAGAIDLCEVHSYEPGNDTMPALVTQNVNLCRAINKPTFMGEMGICRNVQANGSCQGAANATTLQQRATFFQRRLAAAPAAGLSGMLIWQYSPDGSDTTYGVYPGDPVENVMLNLR